MGSLRPEISNVVGFQTYTERQSDETSTVRNALILFEHLKGPGAILEYIRFACNDRTMEETIWFVYRNADGSLSGTCPTDMSSFSTYTAYAFPIVRIWTNIIGLALEFMVYMLFPREQVEIQDMFREAIAEVLMANRDIHDQIQGSDFFHVCWGGIVDTLKECFLGRSIVTIESLRTIAARRMQAAITAFRVANIHPRTVNAVHGMVAEIARNAQQARQDSYYAQAAKEEMNIQLIQSQIVTEQAVRQFQDLAAAVKQAHDTTNNNQRAPVPIAGQAAIGAPAQPQIAFHLDVAQACVPAPDQWKTDAKNALVDALRLLNIASRSAWLTHSTETKHQYLIHLQSSVNNPVFDTGIRAFLVLANNNYDFNELAAHLQ